MTDCPELSVPVHDVTPAGIELQGEVPFSALGISEDARINCPNPMLFALGISLLHGGILVRGHLSTVLRCRCDRCLGYFDCPVETDDVCHLFGIAGQTVIDLTEDIREDILLVFPQQCLCRTDCRGLCPACGQNLNTETCSCLPPDGGKPAWAGLDDLQLPPAPGAWNCGLTRP